MFGATVVVGVAGVTVEVAVNVVVLVLISGIVSVGVVAKFVETNLVSCVVIVLSLLLQFVLHVRDSCLIELRLTLELRGDVVQSRSVALSAVSVAAPLGSVSLFSLTSLRSWLTSSAAISIV